MSYTVSLFHIVFGTKNRRACLPVLFREDLISYFYGISRNLKCDILSQQVMPEHVHILVNLAPDVSLAKYTATIKQSSSLWLKNNTRFTLFEGWAKEYFGSSLSAEAKERVKKYIQSQDDHHGTMNFDDEIRWFVESLGMTFYPDSFN